jgi:peptidoglycan/LPS O-acetylase OafA/YrhL
LGLIRLLLALAVLVGHSWPISGLSFIAPSFAVSIFFAISGFYMALVLAAKYEASPRGTRLFWSNRLLRLFPTYWTILVATVVIYGASVAFGTAPLAATFKANVPWLQGHTLAGLAPGVLLFVVVVNFFIIGQDITLFSSVKPDGSLSLGTNPVGLSAPAHTFLVVPQAWSIALELMFYAVAPFLLRRRLGVLFAVLGGSVVLRIGLESIGLHKDPWTYRFFPTALACFLLGAIAYRLTSAPRAWRPSSRFGLAGLTAAVVLVAFNGRVASLLDLGIPHATGIAQASAMAAVVVFMPAIFELTKNSRIDVFFGDISYPLYLVHYMVILTLGIYSQVFGGFLHTLVRVGTPYTALIAIALSLIIVWLVERPVDRRRQRRVAEYRERADGETRPRAAEITA